VSQYPSGQAVRISYEIRDASGTLVDGTLVHKIKSPAGTITTPATASDGTGLRHYDLTGTSGVWWYRLEATVSSQVYAVEGAISFDETQFG
jgi:hypothetical protein